MKKSDRWIVRETVDAEGLDYAFVNYTDFPEIKDAEFHRLRKAYLAARNALVEYAELEDV